MGGARALYKSTRACTIFHVIDGTSTGSRDLPFDFYTFTYMNGAHVLYKSHAAQAALAKLFHAPVRHQYRACNVPGGFIHAFTGGKNSACIIFQAIHGTSTCPARHGALFSGSFGAAHAVHPGTYCRGCKVHTCTRPAHNRYTKVTPRRAALPFSPMKGRAHTR